MMRAKTRTKNNRISNLRMADCGPEKAGVGGSIPSLATTFSSRLALWSLNRYHGATLGVLPADPRHNRRIAVGSVLRDLDV